MIKKFFSSYVTMIVLLALFAAGMAAATFIEKYHGATLAKLVVYYSPLFFLIQLFLVVNFISIAIRRQLFKLKRWGLLVVHFSFILILTGALITHVFGKEGVLHLREGEISNRVVIQTNRGNSLITLPFQVELVKFTLTRYPGSMSPSSYESELLVHVDGTIRRERVYMNNVLDVKGYRFFQASYDTDEKGTILSVNQDVFGRSVTYSGYLLLLLGCIGCLTGRGSRLRTLYRQVFLLLTFCFISIQSHTQTISDFRFTAQGMGWEGNEDDLNGENEDDFEGEIDNENRTITFTTQRWIENIANLAALFDVECAHDCETKACAVMVGDEIQESGVTENDFRRAVVYTICSGVQYTVQFISPQATGIPVIHIETQDSEAKISKENWTNMTRFVLSDLQNETNTISKGPYTNNQYHRIKGRGNSTWNFRKKPYRIQFREDVSLFGKAARKNWVLLAEYLDPTFLMTAVAFELGARIFQMPFSCTYQHVHLFFNGKYYGLYVLTEHRQADPNGPTGAPGRVGIDQRNGGWFVEIDKNYDESPKFRTVNYALPLMIKEPLYAPNPEDSDDPFYDFIKNDWNVLCDSLLSPNFPRSGYRDFIHMDHFVDYLMANNLIANHELGHPKSAFAYKRDKEDKISMGPLWDIDWAFSYAGSGHTYFTSSTGHIWRHGFFLRFSEDPFFVVKNKERWNDKKSAFDSIPDFIENLGEMIRDAVHEDTKRWMITNGYKSDYNPDHAEMTEKMKYWWKNRMSWLDTELNKMEIIPRRKDFGEISCDYTASDVPSQTFTLATYGSVDQMNVRLNKSVSSAFEITSEIYNWETGQGGHLTKVTVKPRTGLPLGSYSDELQISGLHRGASFLQRLPLNLAVTEPSGNAIVSNPDPLRVWMKNGLLFITDITPSERLTIYTVSGVLIVQSITTSREMTIPLPLPGMYLVKVGNRTAKIVNHVSRFNP